MATARRGFLDHPARFVVAVFAFAALAGTVLLALPVATEDPGGAGLLTASFTAVSAVTITGLVVTDTATHWSSFGEATLLVLIQLGGLGIMTLASLVLVGFSRRLALRHRMVAQLETGVLTLGEVRSVVGVTVVA